MTLNEYEMRYPEEKDKVTEFIKEEENRERSMKLEAAWENKTGCTAYYKPESPSTLWTGYCQYHLGQIANIIDKFKNGDNDDRSIGFQEIEKIINKLEEKY